jgi:hypothetical protein
VVAVSLRHLQAECRLPIPSPPLLYGGFVPDLPRGTNLGAIKLGIIVNVPPCSCDQGAQITKTNRAVRHAMLAFTALLFAGKEPVIGKNQ